MCLFDGRVDIQGSPEDLRAQGALAKVAHEYFEDEKKHTTPVVPDSEEIAADGDLGSKPVTAKVARKLVKDEHREAGSVKWSIYKTYLKASSYWWWAFGIFLVVLRQVGSPTFSVKSELIDCPSL